jgi:Fic-DOC domain mobile mystery protein B
VADKVSALEVPDVPGSTALDPDEAAGLIPRHIRTMGELNEWEQANLLEGRRWLERQWPRKDVLTEHFLRALHKRMFDKTWRWAGTYRTTGKNIGVDAGSIAVEVHKLLQDVRYWLAERTWPTLDETAARFHHRLVWIHPFPNGNGRHARFITDALLLKAGAEPFTWGAATTHADVEQPGGARDRYLAALRAADARDFAPLLAFVRS